MICATIYYVQEENPRAECAHAGKRTRAGSQSWDEKRKWDATTGQGIEEDLALDPAATRTRSPKRGTFVLDIYKACILASKECIKISLLQCGVVMSSSHRHGVGAEQATAEKKSHWLGCLFIAKRKQLNEDERNMKNRRDRKRKKNKTERLKIIGNYFYSSGVVFRCWDMLWSSR